MHRVPAALILLAATSATASPFDYDFDGDFSAVFTEFNDEDDRYFFDQEDGELAYFQNDNPQNGVTDPENNLGVIHNTFLPRNDQSWRASIDVTLPLIYFEQELIAGYVDAGIVAAFFPNGLDSDVGLRFFDSAFRMETDGETGAPTRTLFGSVDDESLPREDSASVDSTTVTVTFEIRFDSQTQVLSALADGSLFFSAPIDASGPLDWNMAGSDEFRIAVFVGSSLEPITGDDAIVFDNFRAAIVPEPSATALLVALAAGIGIGWRRHGPTHG